MDEQPGTPSRPRSTIACHHSSCGTGMTSPPSPSTRRASRAARRRARSIARRHARLARGPGDALRHVPGARRDDAVGELGRRRGAHRRQRAAQLEPADRLQALELQPDPRSSRAGRAACAARRRRSAPARGGSPRAGSISSLCFASSVSWVRTVQSSGNMLVLDQPGEQLDRRALRADDVLADDRARPP